MDEFLLNWKEEFIQLIYRMTEITLISVNASFEI